MSDSDEHSDEDSNHTQILLSTNDIIEFYNNENYDPISSYLKQYSYSSDTKAQQLLKYAINTSRVALFTYIFSIDSFYEHVIVHINNFPILHPQFEYILSTNNNLCNYIETFINTETLIYYYNYPLLKIIMKYVPGINNTILQKLFNKNITTNNLEMLSTLIAYGFNDKFYLSYGAEIKITTLLFLEKNNFDILPKINDIGKMYCYRNNIDGIIFCLNRGADINSIFVIIGENTQYTTVELLITYGADINSISVKNIFDMTDVTTVTYLIDLGLDISNNLDKLIIHAINNNCLELVKYYINYGADIHIHDELFLFFAVALGHIEIVKLLLDVGVDIHARNNSILLFNGRELKNKIINMMGANHSFMNDIRFGHRVKNKFKIFKILLEYGAIITDPQNIYDYYDKSMNAKLDECILKYFLQAGLDLNILPNNNKSIFIHAIRYHKIKIIELLLKFYISLPNNYGLIKFAIKIGDVDIIQMILNAITITPKIIQLLEKYDVNKKLIY